MRMTFNRRGLALASSILALAVAGCATTPGGFNTADGLPPTVPPPPPAAMVDTVDTSLPTQLPRSAVPRHYAITVAPHADTLKFDGKVKIDFEQVQPSNTITLNAADLAIGSAVLRAADGNAIPVTVTSDNKAQTATFTAPQPLAPGAYSLDLDYTGVINTQANGLFALDYTNKEGQKARALYTQFEAPDARRFVPSFDEPDYKATWDLAARVPKGQMVVGNMPVATRVPQADGTDLVTLQTTPLMSSYLLFFGTGDFGRITDRAGPTEVGIVTSRGNEQFAHTALASAKQILPYYNEYFGVDYPLPKLDNVAGPGESQFFSAMENWGAIFTFERVLLDDPSVTTEGERQAIFGVNAHEMAHQWFGDLVTMGWWDDLWLNEGFATWMANRATKHFHPDWGAEFEIVDSRESAMAQDGFVTTHPVVQTIRTVEQSNQAFDGITYQKGSSVISMMEAYASPEVWQKGIRAYMQEHKYKNTKTDDLWRAVEGAGATGLTAIAHQFTLQPGVPMITAGATQCAGGSTKVTLTQGEFSTDRKPGSFTPLKWMVPVMAQTVGGQPVRVMVDGTAQATVPGCGPLLLNAGQSGYYRALYSAANVKALTGAFTTLQPVDQYGALRDNMSLGIIGYQPLGLSLDMLNKVGADAHPVLVGTAAGSWLGMYGTLKGNDAARARLGRMISARFSPLMQKIGYLPKPGEPALVATLRPGLIGVLGGVDDAGVKAEAKRLLANPNAIPGSLKNLWLRQIMATGDASTWETVHQLAKNSKNATERSNFYRLLARTENKALLQKTLDLALTSEPGATVSPGMIQAVAQSDPELAFDFVMAHYDQVMKLVDVSTRGQFVARLGAGSREASMVTKLDTYAKKYLAPTDRSAIDESIAQIKARLERDPRVKKEAAAWVMANLK